MRPRANTISHIDPNVLESVLASHQNASVTRNGGGHPGHSHHASLSAYHRPAQFDYRDMSTSMGQHGQPHGQPHGLPKLDTQLGMEVGGGLRTAPILGYGTDEYDLQKFFGTGSTIDPNQLHHFSGTLGNQGSQFPQFGNPFATRSGLEEDPFNDWNTSLDESLMFSGPNDPMDGIGGSSPSAISSASQSAFSEVMVDGSGQQTSTALWPNTMIANPGVNTMPFGLNMDPMFPGLIRSTVSPKELQDQGTAADYGLSSPLITSSNGVPSMPNQYFQPPMVFNTDSPSISSPSMNGSARHSSVTSVATGTITDATRQTLLVNLSQALGLGHSQRRYSQPQVGSLSMSSGKGQTQMATLPSTQDLQRFVNAYIQYYHPHIPFLHIPTLSFDTPTYGYQYHNPTQFTQDGMIGGGGCLILAMAAIGALYERDPHVANELFEAGRKLLLFYLDERRRAGLAAAGLNGPTASKESINNPPLWLIQAMLLNLIYGHNCGDKQAAEVASTHCAALVSLAHAAGLSRPASDDLSQNNSQPASQPTPTSSNGDTEMADMLSSDPPQKASQPDMMDEHAQWIQWKKVEERKRTYFAIFAMSSLLVSAYAHQPRILNSEIKLDLPCEEEIWAAESAQAWAALGGPAAAQSKGLSFTDALTYLLGASNRQNSPSQVHSTIPPHFQGGAPLRNSPQSGIRPSTFGCYVLINALHVYIWETRQRLNGRLWKPQETKQMHAQVEPALGAWQAAWRANPKHGIERPSQYGPLAADCIPLLDLAYMRLYVDLGRSKEFLWQRDLMGMAEELAKGFEIVSQSDGSLDVNDPSRVPAASNSPPGVVTSPHDLDMLNETNPGNSRSNMQSSQAERRARHLRKAAFYAADSLSMADILGSTYTDLSARELPTSSVMCTFDCAQILAEWVVAIQAHAGPYIGILGKDDISLNDVPAIMVLQDEDVKLLYKIQAILTQAEMRLALDPSTMQHINFEGLGYGTRLLLVTARMLERSAIWPGMSVPF